MRDRKRSPIHPFALQSHTQLKAAQKFLCAVGVVPTRVYPKSGRISALAGRQGSLTSVYNKRTAIFPVQPPLSNCQLLNHGDSLGFRFSGGN
ncbi:hypothetical protein FK765_26515 [Escherichia coli]|nr:hypothetical protein [Escherichia coli]